LRCGTTPRDFIRGAFRTRERFSIAAFVVRGRAFSLRTTSCGGGGGGGEEPAPYRFISIRRAHNGVPRGGYCYRGDDDH